MKTDWTSCWNVTDVKKWLLSQLRARNKNRGDQFDSDDWIIKALGAPVCKVCSVWRIEQVRGVTFSATVAYAHCVQVRFQISSVSAGFRVMLRAFLLVSLCLSVRPHGCNNCAVIEHSWVIPRVLTNTDLRWIAWTPNMLVEAVPCLDMYSKVPDW